jgi:hypothetical protein
MAVKARKAGESRKAGEDRMALKPVEARISRMAAQAGKALDPWMAGKGRTAREAVKARKPGEARKPAVRRKARASRPERRGAPDGRRGGRVARRLQPHEPYKTASVPTRTAFLMPDSFCETVFVMPHAPEQDGIRRAARAIQYGACHAA